MILKHITFEAGSHVKILKQKIIHYLNLGAKYSDYPLYDYKIYPGTTIKIYIILKLEAHVPMKEHTINDLHLLVIIIR
jgi:hypothetical protein